MDNYMEMLVLWINGTLNSPHLLVEVFMQIAFDEKGAHILRNGVPYTLETAQEFYVMRQHAACDAPIIPCGWSQQEERLRQMTWETLELRLEDQWQCVLMKQYAEELDHAAP